MNCNKSLWLILPVILLLAGCQKTDDDGVSLNENKILKFILQDYGIRGSIDHDQNTILVEAGALVDLSSLRLMLVVSDGATVMPSGDLPADLTTPESFTVVSGNGASRTYNVTARQYTDTALLIVDLQNGFFPFYNDDSVVFRTRTLIDKARNAEKHVIFVQTDYTSPTGDPDSPIGTWKFDMPGSLDPRPDDLYVTKWGQDSFDRDTKLIIILNDHELGSLVVCGIATQACVNGTIEGGLKLGYRIIVAGDAHSSYDPYAQQRIDSYNNTIWPAMGVIVNFSSGIEF